MARSENISHDVGRLETARRFEFGSQKSIKFKSQKRFLGNMKIFAAYDAATLDPGPFVAPSLKPYAPYTLRCR